MDTEQNKDKLIRLESLFNVLVQIKLKVTRPIEFENRMQLEHCHGKKYLEKDWGQGSEISSFNLEAGKSLYPEAENQFF